MAAAFVPGSPWFSKACVRVLNSEGVAAGERRVPRTGSASKHSTRPRRTPFLYLPFTLPRIVDDVDLQLSGVQAGQDYRSLCVACCGRVRRVLMAWAAFVTLIALTWISLLSVVAFAWWGIVGTSERQWCCQTL
jgi:hypothetical protein